MKRSKLIRALHAANYAPLFAPNGEQRDRASVCEADFEAVASVGLEFKCSMLNAK